jgi:hypothetical protein
VLSERDQIDHDLRGEREKRPTVFRKLTSVTVDMNYCVARTRFRLAAMKHCDIVAIFEQQTRKMGTDESSSAKDQYLHGASFIG